MEPTLPGFNQYCRELTCLAQGHGAACGDQTYAFFFLSFCVNAEIKSMKMLTFRLKQTFVRFKCKLMNLVRLIKARIKLQRVPKNCSFLTFLMVAPPLPMIFLCTSLNTCT